MPTWPSATKATTTHLDSGTDSPRLARTDLKQNVDNVNDIIDMFNISSPANNQILKYSTSNSRFELASETTASPITFVGDDSTGTAVNVGETFKIAGTQNITTAVSGDTLTITGPNLSNYLTSSSITFVGDDSTGTAVSNNETFKIAGTQNITTAVSGDILTITGPDLSSYLTAVPSTIAVNEISSSDSSAIQINDGVNISGATTLHGSTRFNNHYTEKINTLASSTAITVDASTAPVHKVYLENNTTFKVTNLGTGGSITLIIQQDSTGSRLGAFVSDDSTAIRFAGGTPSLSTAGNSIDIVNIFNDGTFYFGNIAKAFA